MANYFLILIAIIYSSSSLASACCGGGGGSSSVITSDNRYKTEFIYSNKAYLYDIDDDGKASKRDNSLQEVQEKLTSSYAYLFDNYFQIHGSLIVNKTTKKTSLYDESLTTLSDLKLGVTYEFLPETYYSLAKPRGFIYLTHSVPLGNSRYNSSESSGVDISTTGLHQTTLGLMFFKIIKDFDFKVSSEVSKFYPRKFDLKISKDNSYNYSFSSGYSPASFSGFRFGVSVTKYIEGRYRIDNNSKDSNYSSLLFNLAYLLNEFNSFLLSYEDETVFGEPRNVGLGRKLSLSYTYLSPL